MHVLVDQLLIDRLPSLIDNAERSRPRITVDSFNFLATTHPTNWFLDGRCPDLVVVDRVWLHLSPLLLRILEVAGCRATGCGPARVVIATRNVDDVFRVQVIHRGFHDYLDLDQPPRDLLENLAEIHGRAPAQSFEYLWNSVPLPPLVATPGDVPHDDIDRSILDLISVGMQDADIAGVVHVSTQTVKNRISTMLSRSGLRNRTQLAWSYSNQTVIDIVVRASNEYASTTSTGRS